MTINQLLTAVLMCLLLALPVSAQEPDPAEANRAGEEQPRERRELQRLGLIFNTPDILLSPDQYQGLGVGVKGVWDHMAARGLLGLTFDTANSFFGLALGGALEFHLASGVASPYFGGQLLLEYSHDDRMAGTVRTFGAGAGPLFGVEIAPFEILSIFAEYALTFRASYASTAGAMEDDQRWNYAIGTGLGNQGAIGIIVYFLDRRPATDDAGVEDAAAEGS